MSVLRTERLILRKAREDDLDALHAILSDRQAMRYWSSLPHRDIEETRAWLADMMAAPAGESDDFIVECDGCLIGKLGAWRLPEIGFLFGRSHWGKGFAREALSAYLDHAFAAGADHLTADVDPRNARSLAVLVRAGFYETGRAERTWRIGEEWCDSIYLRLDRRDP